MPDQSKIFKEKLSNTLETFRAFREDISKILILSKLSMSRLSNEDKIVEAKANWERSAGKFNASEYKRDIMFAREIAEFSAREVSNKFSILHMHATIALWTAIEVLSKDFVAIWLQENSHMLSSEKLKKIKVSAASFALSEDERFWFLAEEIEKIFSQEGAVGISKYERLFKIFGFGFIDAKEKTNLNELYFVRNLLVHQRGKVDHRFIKACPWLRKKLGEVIQVSENDFSRYWDASQVYFKFLKKYV